MPISLHVTATPDRWPHDAACDVALRFTLRNDSAAKVSVAARVAQLDAMSSNAGIGIAWHVELVDANEVAAPMQEIRTYYGPPGNPPSPQWVKDQAVTIKPAAEYVRELVACWIPNMLLEPRHLRADALDPERMDNIAGPSRGPMLALAERFPLERASVVVVGASWAQLAAARSADDFLRGHVVAFIAQPGAFELRVQYVQDSWLGIGERMRIAAAPVAITAGT
jgi:hypothetical protein